MLIRLIYCGIFIFTFFDIFYIIAAEVQNVNTALTQNNTEKIQFEQLEQLFNNFYPWLAGLYDPEEGGFYFSLKHKNDKQLQPDIESTAQAISILYRSGLLPEMPATFRQKLINFFQKRQDPNTGFFIDQNIERHNNERWRGRALSYSISSLSKLKAKPLYPLPGEKNTGANPNPYLSHFESPEIFQNWLNNRPWNNAWGALDQVSSQIPNLKLFPKAKRDQLLTILFKDLAKRQDSNSGLWGGGSPYRKISGAFKIAMVYKSFKKPIPRANKIYKSTLECLRNNKAEDICFVRNPLNLITMLRNDLGRPISNADKTQISNITIKNLAMFATDQGGFRGKLSAPLASAPAIYRNYHEANLNACSSAFTVRQLLYALSGMKVPLVSNTDVFLIIKKYGNSRYESYRTDYRSRIY